MNGENWDSREVRELLKRKLLGVNIQARGRILRVLICDLIQGETSSRHWIKSDMVCVALK